MKQVHNESHTYTAVRITLKEKSRLTLHLRGQNKGSSVPVACCTWTDRLFSMSYDSIHICPLSRWTPTVFQRLHSDTVHKTQREIYSVPAKYGLFTLIINMPDLWITNIAFEIYMSYILWKNSVSNVCWNVSNEISLICRLFLLDSNEIKWRANDFCLCLVDSRLLLSFWRDLTSVSNYAQVWQDISTWTNILLIKFLPDQIIWATVCYQHSLTRWFVSFLYFSWGNFGEPQWTNIEVNWTE